MLKRPKFLLENNKVYSLRGKFNAIVEERLNDGNAENHKIMSIDIQPADYDLAGNLMLAGMRTFWTEGDRAMKRFDENTITLNPRENAPTPKTPKPAQPVKSTVPTVETHTQCKLLMPPPLIMELESRAKSAGGHHTSNSPKRKRKRSKSRSRSRSRH